jgi:hypothetical protein
MHISSVSSHPVHPLLSGIVYAPLFRNIDMLKKVKQIKKFETGKYYDKLNKVRVLNSQSNYFTGRT